MDMKTKSATIDQCEVTVIHEERVNQVKNESLPKETIEQLALVFQAFSDPTRLRILHALTQTEMCVCDLAAAMQMTQSAISHQLRKLKQTQMVRSRKEGRTVYYQLHDDHVDTVFQIGLSHVMHLDAE